MPLSHSDDLYWLAGGTRMVPTATAPAMAFVNEHSRLLDFALFATQAFLDKANASIGVENSSDGSDDNDEMLQELILTRTVDNFLCFLSDLLALIYKTKPQMLRSSEQERLDFVLNFESMDELRAAVAEKKVERLSYLGLRDLNDSLRGQMGFELFGSPKDLSEAAVLVEMRNICVHARGVVGATSARRFAEFKDLLGKRLDFSHERIRACRKFLENAVFDIDVRATEKFSLPCCKVPKPPSHLIGAE